MKAILLISHGSRSSKARDEVEELVVRLQSQTGVRIFEFAFLEVESPTIPEGFKACVDKGATEITVLLHFLNSGNHVLKDIPEIIKKEKEKYPNISISQTPHLGSCKSIETIYLDLIKE